MPSSPELARRRTTRDVADASDASDNAASDNAANDNVASGYANS